MLGRTETRTRDRMYCQTVRDISRDDRARITTCSLRMPTDRDRLKENYIIDNIKIYSGTSLLRSPTGLDKSNLNGEVTLLQGVICTVEYSLGLEPG